LMVSQRPPSSFFVLLPTYLLLFSLTSVDLCSWNMTAEAVFIRVASREGFALSPKGKPLSMDLFVTAVSSGDRNPSCRGML
jgi:hypothetical protein